MNRTWIALSFLGLSAFGASFARAQVDTGTIVGTVRDTSGAVVPGATIVATEKTTNASTRIVTDSLGSYVFPSLNVGAYDVTAELAGSGFKKATKENVVLRVQDRLRVDFTLELGDI